MNPTDAVDFPYIVVARLIPILTAQIEPVHLNDTDAPTEVFVVGRAFSTMDPSPTVGVYPVDWHPVDFEIDGSGFADATISRYNYGIDVLVQHSEVEEGSRVHGELSRRVRNLIMRNRDVRDALSGLSVASDYVERVSRWGITAQAFASAEIQGSMSFVSGIQMYVETELVGPV